MQVFEKNGPWSYDKKTKLNGIFKSTISAKSKNFDLFQSLATLDVDEIEELSKVEWEEKNPIKFFNNFMDCGTYYGQVDSSGQPEGMGRRVGHGDSVYEGQY